MDNAVSIKGNTINIGLYDVDIEGVENVLIDLVHVRAAMPILVSFSFDRDGWVVKQLLEGEGKNGEWDVEVAFIPSFSQRTRFGTDRRI